MTNKIFALFVLSIFVFAFLVMGVSAVTNLGTWSLNIDATGVSYDSTKLTANPLTVTGVTLGTFSADGATADAWAATGGPAAGEYYEVSLTVPTGLNNYVITSIDFSHMVDVADVGETIKIEANYSTSTNFASPKQLVSATTSTNTQALSSTNTKIALASGQTFTLRVFGYDATSTTTTSLNLENIIIKGDLVPTEVVECLATAGNGNGQMTVDDIDLSVEDGYGEDDEWFPLDLVNIETNVESNGDSDFEIKNIEVVWGLFDRDTNKWIIDDAEKDFDLEGGDDLDVTIQVKLDEKIDKLAAGDIVAYAIATGEDEENNDQDTCEYKEASVSMKSENALILDNIQAPTTAVQCSSEVLVTADIWNIGDDKLENNYILVTNTELGINNQKIEVGDINDFDNSALDFTFIVPAGAVEKSYNLLFSLYDEDDDIFEINDEEAKFIVPLTVSGGCAGTSSPVTVSASLVSGGKAGQPLTVRATVTNSGTNTANYTVNAQGYGQWADSATLSETTFSLNAGQSKDVTITLATKSGVSGEQTFNVEVLSGNQLVMTQPVSVVLESSGFLSSITGGAIGGNATIWLIGLINVILVLAIIMVAVRFFRK